MIDAALAIVVGIVAWTVAAEGAFGAAAIFLSVVVSGLIAMDVFEPLANLLESFLGTDWSNRVDFIALVGAFAACVFGLRTMSERLAPNFIAVSGRVYDVFRWSFALATGYVTMAFLLTALHTAPLPRNFLGFTPERDNFFNVAAPDRQWLGFVQYVSENSLSASDLRIFDGPRFLVPNHENQVWPSFVIRYATRRGSGGSSMMSQASPTSAPTTPRLVPHTGGQAHPGGL
jgi:hypothetical protein